MSNHDAKNPLTASNLALHDRLLEQQESNIPPVSWAEKVIKEEQIHQFYYSSSLKPQNPEIDDAVGGMERLTIDNALMAGSLKLFEPRQGMCLESPLERFLTPDGCGVPSYFTRSALEKMGVHFGSMDGQDERKKRARENANSVGRTKRGVDTGKVVG